MYIYLFVMKSWKFGISIIVPSSAVCGLNRERPIVTRVSGENCQLTQRYWLIRENNYCC